MTEWELFRDSGTKETNLLDVTTTDSANPFGDFAVATIDDFQGDRFDKYEFGTKVDIDVLPDNQTAQDDFTGFVVERRETDQRGADTLEVEAYTFDQFLRRNDVSNDQSGNTISTALENIIKNDTPVTFNSNLVNVGNNQGLTLSLQDEKVETALQILSFKSENESFGVNSNFEFFFRERETKHIDRGIDNTDWFNYDLPERGKEAINEVEVRYNQGNDRVVVDNPGQKLDLQDNLNLPEPGTQRVRINRPEITDTRDAEDEGRRFLKFRNATLSGTVSTYGLYDAEPFDTINVEITDRGIDSEFIITKVEKNWARDETTLTLVENRGFDEDFIVRLTEKTERIDLRDSDPDAQIDRITSTNIPVNVSVSADVDGHTPDAIRFVNDGRNVLRNGWVGDSLKEVFTIRLANDGTGLSRSNSSVKGFGPEGSVSESFPAATSVKYTSRVALSESGIEEVGLLTVDDTLLVRGIFTDPINVNGKVSVTLSFENDSSTPRGVLTNTGQTTARDIIADNTPNLAEEYAYGSGDSSPSESDTALDTQEFTADLTEILVQSASTDSAFSNIVTTDSTTPIDVNNDSLGSTQVAFTKEGENLSGSFVTGTPESGDTKLSNDDSALLQFDDEFWEFTFTPTIDIPESQVGLYVRNDSIGNGTPQITFSLNGSSWTPIVSGAGLGSIDWDDYSTVTKGGSGSYSGGQLDAGTTYTFRADADTDESTTDGWRADAVSVQHTGFSYTFDNSTSNTGERISGPEEFPQQETISLETASTRQQTDSARFSSTWTDTSNNQYVELANDGTNFTRFNNANSGSVTFSSQDSGIDSNLAFSRYGSDPNNTPTSGFKGQRIQEWNLFAGIVGRIPDGIGAVNIRGIVSNSDLTVGTVLEEAAQLDANGNALTRSVFADTEIESDTNDLISSETLTFRNP